MTCGIYTLGCRVNQYESEAIAEKLAESGVLVQSADERCDAYIINTCTVTAESARKARQFIRRALGANSDAWILVTGCYAQTEADMVAQIKGWTISAAHEISSQPWQALLRLVRDGKSRRGPSSACLSL